MFSGPEEVSQGQLYAIIVAQYLGFSKNGEGQRTDFEFRVCCEKSGVIDGPEKIVLNDELGPFAGLTDDLEKCQFGTPEQFQFSIVWKYN